MNEGRKGVLMVPKEGPAYRGPSLSRAAAHDYVDTDAFQNVCQDHVNVIT